MSLKKILRAAKKAGFAEKDCTLPDGTVIHYGEGPGAGSTANGAQAKGKQPLLLIHGQTGAWQDYADVLEPLSRDYHIFAVDCHGHGKSSKDPGKYKAKEIGKDLLWFIKNVMGLPAVVSGHSSGGLIAAWLAANGGRDVNGVVLEDPPIFSTEEGERWEKSFAYVDTYSTIHGFLNQSEEQDWILYYLKHAMWGKFIKGNGMEKMIAYGEKYRRKHPDEPLDYFFLPDSVNRMFWFVDEYDLRFGDAFYDCSWFEDYDREDILRRITCPAVLIHTKWSVDEEGILMAAMSGEDAERANALMPDSELIYIDSGHDSHAEKPKEFIAAFDNLRQRMV